MSKPHTIRWGIMATGGIAKTFTKDLFVDPKTRGADDNHHTVTAVASSSSVDSAKNFISEIISPKQSQPTCKAYGSYEELVKDPEIDIVYVATPHSHHFQNCMLALSHNKNILCEKAFTVNADQAKLLYKTAKEKNLFLMEAVWTRYFPLSIYVREQIQSGAIGEVLRIFADLSPGINAADFDTGHRMVNKDLCGGALMDLGIYALTAVFQFGYHTVPAAKRKAPTSVAGTISHEPRTGADQMTSMLLSFPHSAPSGADNPFHAVAVTAMNIDMDPDGQFTAGPPVRIYGTKGEIQVFGPTYRPNRIKIIPREKTEFSSSGPFKGNAKGNITEKTFEFPGGGHGMFWEADEAARCVRDGKLESETMTWEESTVIMEVMDKVREQGGLKYPEAIESTKYPVDLKARGL